MECATKPCEDKYCGLSSKRRRGADIPSYDTEEDKDARVICGFEKDNEESESVEVDDISPDVC